MPSRLRVFGLSRLPESRVRVRHTYSDYARVWFPETAAKSCLCRAVESLLPNPGNARGGTLRPRPQELLLDSKRAASGP